MCQLTNCGRLLINIKADAIAPLFAALRRQPVSITFAQVLLYKAKEGETCTEVVLIFVGAPIAVAPHFVVTKCIIGLS